MGRINIEIPDEIHRKMKSTCALKGTVLESFINEAVSERLKQDQKRRLP